MEAKEALDRGLVGAQLDKYLLIDEVGYGGMSVVYQAHDEVLDREVAVKLLHAHLSKRPEARRRFHREARAVAKLQHPNIVEIYDFSGEDSRYSYIVTEFIRGPTLRELVEERGVLFPEIGAMIAIPVGEAVAHAHELGVIHRDIKPENVMIRDDGVVKLMDFGIAQLRDSKRMTETGSLLGSPAHMAPEVVSGEEPDARSDIFSFGTVLYYLTTGELPFAGRNAASMLRSIVEGNYVDPEMRSPRIGQQLGKVIRRCLERDPADRYQHIDEAVSALRSCVDDLGFVDPTSELRQYFSAPDEYEQAFRGRILEALERRGREALEAREIARAVDCFNRVLAIDDQHEGVRKLLGRLDRRRRMAGYGIAIAALVVMIAGVIYTVSLFASGDGDGPEERPADPQDVAIIDAEERALDVVYKADTVLSAVTTDTARELAQDWIQNATSVSTAASHQAVRQHADDFGKRHGAGVEQQCRLIAVYMSRVIAEREPPRNGRERPAIEEPEDPQDVEEVAVVEETRIPVRLRPHPRIVVFSIDGERYGDLGDFSEVMLTPGRHTVEYSHTRVQPRSQVIDVPDSLAPEENFFSPQPWMLQWQDAIIQVSSNLPAVVLVDNVDVGPAGRPIRIPIDSRQHRNGRIEVNITVIPSEGEEAELITFRDVELRAAERREFDATFH